MWYGSVKIKGKSFSWKAPSYRDSSRSELVLVLTAFIRFVASVMELSLSILLGTNKLADFVDTLSRFDVSVHSRYFVSVANS